MGIHGEAMQAAAESRAANLLVIADYNALPDEMVSTADAGLNQCCTAGTNGEGGPSQHVLVVSDFAPGQGLVPSDGAAGGDGPSTGFGRDGETSMECDFRSPAVADLCSGPPPPSAASEDLTSDKGMPESAVRDSQQSSADVVMLAGEWLWRVRGSEGFAAEEGGHKGAAQAAEGQVDWSDCLFNAARWGSDNTCRAEAETHAVCIMRVLHLVPI